MEKNIEKFKECKEKGTVLKGRIKLVEKSKKYGTDILTIDLQDAVGIIKREDFDIKDRKESLVKYVGANIKFVIVDIEEDGTLICSRKVVKEFEREVLIKELEGGAEVEGKILKIVKFGAFLNVKGTTVVLKNIDFSEDHTTVMDKHKEGDKIKVKLQRVTSTKKILVQAVEKFCNPTSINFDSFSENQVATGVIRTIKSWGCYVCVAPNLDVLTPVPELPDGDVEEGTTVLIKIKTVNKEERKIRGRILKVISEDTEYDFE